ncbi:tetratricopeptide repeat protein [Cerasicoccus arenae]|uniref:Tetratricopeptide repeat protein n=1 Tax=Cerasicoccus arenae TaxID=424488 RepID=A0A8J3DC87_9BACT|nr:tetratricopeptide repeat protein [Cerasicoccus arenae]MBK1858261.1 tetratricopeptide repeat protein [Cerasicoccus arenae]GHC02241.1 hypothetical protein GCM10007047_18470 [Cerasicoccus arenae]
MKEKLILLMLLGVVAVTANGQTSSGAKLPGEPSAPSVLDDPEWQKRFLGSYGFRSTLEPKVSAEEVEVLRELIDLMKADPKAAAAQLEAGTNENSSAALNFILANLYFQTGDTDSAKKYYLIAVEKHPDYMRAHKNLGLLLMQEQDMKGALKHLSRTTELGEMDGRTQGLMGYGYLSEGDFIAAEECYRDAIQMEPDVIDWKLGVGRVLIETGRNGESIALFNSLIKENPSDSKLWLLQANAYLAENQPESAAVNLEMVRSMNEADTESLRLLGDIYLNMKIADLALDAYVEAMHKSGNQGGVKLAIRSAKLLNQTGSPEKAKELLEQTLATYEGEISNDQNLEILILQASLARSLGNANEAINVLEDIVKQDGMQGEALIELATIYSERGQENDQEQAYLLLKRAQKISGFEYDSMVKHAQMLVRERKYKEAAQLLEGALQIKEDARTRDFLIRVRRAMRA